MKILEFAGKHPVVAVIAVWSLAGVAHAIIGAFAHSKVERAAK